jgi:hypothetical protein
VSFSDDLRRFTAKAETNIRDVHAGTVVRLHESITVGSPVTGSPGQPVDFGNLVRSWGIEDEGDARSLISTPMEYAPGIEDGIGPHGPLTLRSAVGGFHSLKHTIAGAQRVVELEAQRVAETRGGR